MNVLIITSEWPCKERPFAVPFLVREVNQIKKMGVKVDIFSFKGAKKFQNYFLSWKKVRSILKKKEYDIIHVHWGYNTILSLPTKTPIVITYRGDDLNGISYMDGITNKLKSFIVVLISQISSYFAASTILVTKSFTKKLNKNIPSYIIPSGIDLNIFRPMDKNHCKEKLNFKKDQKIILFAGNKTDKVKNYDLALLVFKKVQQSINNVILTTIPLNTDMNIVPYYMNSADCILFTSLQEGSPNVIKEALACNVPIVSTNIGDVEDRLKNIEGCIVCNDYNVDSLANATMEILKLHNKIDGRKSVQSLDLESTTKRIIKVYENVIKIKT